MRTEGWRNGEWGMGRKVKNKEGAVSHQYIAWAVLREENAHKNSTLSGHWLRHKLVPSAYGAPRPSSTSLTKTHLRSDRFISDTRSSSLTRNIPGTIYLRRPPTYPPPPKDMTRLRSAFISVSNSESLALITLYYHIIPLSSCQLTNGRFHPLKKTPPHSMTLLNPPPRAPPPPNKSSHICNIYFFYFYKAHPGRDVL